MRGYLLIELLFAIVLVMISVSTFAYYTTYKLHINSEAVQECEALSLARNELEQLNITRKFSSNRYTKNIFLITRHDVPYTKGGYYQKQLRKINVRVSWTTKKGKKKSIVLTTIR